MLSKDLSKPTDVYSQVMQNPTSRKEAADILQNVYFGEPSAQNKALLKAFQAHFFKEVNYMHSDSTFYIKHIFV